jgi:hypothetical protein
MLDPGKTEIYLQVHMVTHVCNPSYLGGGGRKNMSYDQSEEIYGGLISKATYRQKD